MPAAFGANGTHRQIVGIWESRIRGQDPVDHAATSVSPLATSISDARIGEAKTFFRRAPFVGELDEEFVDSPPLLEARYCTVRLDHAQEDGARRASGTRAERSGCGPDAFAELRHARLTNFLF